MVWQGERIGITRHGKELLAALKSGSVLYLDFEVLRGKYYELKLTTKDSTSGLSLKVVGGQVVDSKFVFILAGSGRASVRLEVSNTAGEVLVSEAKVVEAPRPKREPKIIPPPPPLTVIKAPAATDEIQRQAQTGMTPITGKWRGKNIKTVFAAGKTCAVLYGPQSMVLARIPVESLAEYRFIITAKGAGGDGRVYINLFGGQAFDGPIQELTLISSVFGEYTILLRASKFPPGTEVSLRVWNRGKGSGQITVESICYEKLGDYVEPAQTITPATKESPQLSDVAFDAGFKPFNKSEHIMEEANKVLVSCASDVPKVSIITPTRDGYQLIKDCYEALSKNTAYPNWEWIVGDSASTDQTVEYVESLNDVRVKLVKRGTTTGTFSSINNELVKCSDGEYVLFLNNDTQPQPFWLYNMVAKIHRAPEIGVVGARLLYPNHTIQHCGIVFSPGPCNMGVGIMGGVSKDYAEVDRYYQAVTGACLLMRRADFDAVGGFDERLKWCYDDCDLCLKMMSIGKKVMYSSRAIVIHQESVSQKKLGTNSEDSAAYFKDKWRGNIKIDINQYMRVPNYGACKPVLSFVSCVKNPEVYARCLGSLFKNQTNKNYEVIPILNLNNKYSAAKALNLGLSRAQADVVVFCHSDIVFLDGWIDRMMAGIANVAKTDPKWGVIGSAGIDENECTYGVVYSLSGGVGWGQTKGISVGKVQTVDELCFAVRKNSGLRLDEGLGGFHFYAVELCLQARSKGLSNYVLLNPLIHASKAGESSLNGGKADFMKWLNYVANKWGGRFKKIRTTTSIIQNKVARTFLTFKE